MKVMMLKRTYEKAFERKLLNKVEVGDFCVEICMFKVDKKIKKGLTDGYSVITTENKPFFYGLGVIEKRSKSATAFNQEQQFTKTELIELFANMSIHDVWSAQYQTLNKTKEWQRELARTIKGQKINEASDYIKKNFASFGKVNRTIIGHKINPTSVNNYYIVRDLTIHFDLLQEGKSEQDAHSQSIRSLDVNSLQFLIFNGVKYILKST